MLPSYVEDCQVYQGVDLSSAMLDSQVSQESVQPSYVVDSVASQEGMQLSHSLDVVPGLKETSLNAEAEVFAPIDHSRIHPGRRGVSLLDDAHHVQRVQDGGVGLQDDSVAEIWNTGTSTGCMADLRSCKGWTAGEMPFDGVESIPDIMGVAPKQIQKVSKLLDLQVKMPRGSFTDKVLPAPGHRLESNTVFTA